MTAIETFMAKAAAGFLIVLGLLVAGGYVGYRYEDGVFKQYVAQQAIVAQQAKDAAAAAEAHDKEVKDAIDAKDATELAGYAGYVNELLLRNQSLLHARSGGSTVPQAAPGARHPDAATDGHAAGSTDSVVSCPDTSAAGDDPADHVTLDALEQLKAWRGYARGTGQAK
jgi:hypothetical protein